jgi:hypothetical protein
MQIERCLTAPRAYRAVLPGTCVPHRKVSIPIAITIDGSFPSPTTGDLQRRMRAPSLSPNARNTARENLMSGRSLFWFQ